MLTLFRSKKTRKKGKSLSPSAKKKLDEEYIQYLKIKSKGTKKTSSEMSETVKSMLPEIRQMAKVDREKERLEKEHQALTLRLKKLNRELTTGEKKILLELSMPTPPRNKIRGRQTKKGGKRKKYRKRNGKTKKNN